MSKRISIYTDAFAHVNPTPAACRIGPILVSGVINGRAPTSEAATPDLEAQCALMFQRVRAIAEAGGGSTDDILKVTVWMKDPANREPVNREWVKIFPDPAARPARQVMRADLADGILVQCDFMAVLDGPAG